jgi:hypothetical protein
MCKDAGIIGADRSVWGMNYLRHLKPPRLCIGPWNWKCGQGPTVRCRAIVIIIIIIIIIIISSSSSSSSSSSIEAIWRKW